tara:strand:+ start:704 stop:1279 length:576 start_codon:yes stop_codon:yes gene_type:complete
MLKSQSREAEKLKLCEEEFAKLHADIMNATQNNPSLSDFFENLYKNINSRPEVVNAGLGFAEHDTLGKLNICKAKNDIIENEVRKIGVHNLYEDETDEDKLRRLIRDKVIDGKKPHEKYHDFLAKMDHTNPDLIDRIKLEVEKEKEKASRIDKGGAKKKKNTTKRRILRKRKRLTKRKRSKKKKRHTKRKI